MLEASNRDAEREEGGEGPLTDLVEGASCGLIRPDAASYTGSGKEGVDFGLLLAVLLSLDGVVPGPDPLTGEKLQDFSSFPFIR